MFFLQLKSYSVGTDETDRFYAQYFDGDKFIVIGSDIRETTTLLLGFEYVGAIGFALVIYILLIFSAFDIENIEYIGYFLSEMSLPCLGFWITIVIYNTHYYRNSLQYRNSEWLKSLPVPVIFPVFSVVNLIISIIIIAVVTKIEKKKNKAKYKNGGDKDGSGNEQEEKNFTVIPLSSMTGKRARDTATTNQAENKEKERESFPVPSICQLLFFSHDHCPKVMNWFKKCIQVILLFSITSFVFVITFHFIWVALGFSAYPVRSIATLGSVLPIIFISVAVFFIIEIVAMILEEKYKDDKACKVVKWLDDKLGVKTEHLDMKDVIRKRKLAFALVVSILIFPLLGCIFGVLYFYSKAITDVNDSENNPLKTVIAAAIPTLLIGLFTYIGGKVFHSYISEPQPQKINIVQISEKVVTELKKNFESEDDKQQPKETQIN